MKQMPSIPAPPAPVLPPRATADGTLRRVQEAALALFGARGFHGVSIREIANEVGVRASSFYAHLASKEQLLADLMMLGHEEHREGLRRALLESGADPEEQIRSVMREHVRFHATYSLLGRVCNRELAALSEDNRQRVIAMRLDTEQMLVDVIERGARLGVFDAPEPFLAMAAFGSLGIRVAEWWDPDLGFTVEQVADRYGDFIVKMLRQP
ncbi:MAG: TetR/AcrR family transcriptional regulator [Acidimicrobiales bacterium]